MSVLVIFFLTKMKKLKIADDITSTGKLYITNFGSCNMKICTLIFPGEEYEIKLVMLNIQPNCIW